jgi:acyl-coenzyme A thioesterase 9
VKAHPENHYPIASTIVKNTMLMQIQDKNLNGKVFGGLILRAGYELGWLCAARFLKTSVPVLEHVDDVQFLAPVEIGTYLELEAKIGYVTDKFAHVIVTCVNWQISGKSLLTNVLRVTF